MHRRALLLSPLALAAQTRPIRTAVIGGTHSHADAKIKLLMKDPRFELAGLVAETDQVAARYPGVPRLTQEQALADPATQLCFIESDVPLHPQQALAALKAGKHVHVEKPPALNVTDLRLMLDLAKQKGLLVQQGYMWRFHPGINRALEMVRAGEIGEVYLIRGMINTSVNAAQRAAFGRFAGGQMFELGCHLIDPIVRLLGRPTEVTPILRREGADNLRDNTTVTFQFPHAMAIVSSATLMKNATPYRGLEIYGSTGNIIVRPIEGPAPQLLIDRNGKLETVALPPFRRYLGELGELAACVPQRKPLSVSAADDLIVQEALLRACEMLLTRKTNP